jgi:hypothetical protein
LKEKAKSGGGFIGGVCRAATNFACAAGTLRHGDDLINE